MNKTAKLTAAKKQYEIDANNNLWTRPRGSRPIVQARIYVVLNGLTYSIATDEVRAALAPKKAKPKCKECKSTNKHHKLSCGSKEKPNVKES